MSDLAREIQGLRSAAPHLDWAKIEKTLVEGMSLTGRSKRLTFHDIYGDKDVHVRTCQEGGEQHIWKVVHVKLGRVWWRCVCGVETSKQVRVFGILPAYLLFRRNWSGLQSDTDERHAAEEVVSVRSVE